MKKYVLITMMVVTAMMMTACPSINTTKDAYARMNVALIPAYTEYIYADASLSDSTKLSKVEAVSSYSFSEACRVVVPKYMAYVEADSTLSEAKKNALLSNARSYMYINNHFEGRR
jgi:hypothetical protein